MNSFKNSRVVVASLFLPSTVQFASDSPIPTPDARLPAFSVPDVLQRVEAVVGGGEKPRLGSLPVKSIVEDLLSVQTRNPTPNVLSPRLEEVNPFNARKHQTTHSDHRPRIQRKPSSRSSSRRPESEHSVRDDWHVEYNAHCNGGLHNAIVSMGDKLKKKLCVGSIGTHTDLFSEPLRRAVDRRMLVEHASVPVWIPDAEFESCYDEFCHLVLWPSLHYAIPDAPKTTLFYESAAFKQYVAVNQRFADVIAANYQDGDIIWINDYHLMLLPAMLRASPRIPDHAPIGFFMHVAFPSSEIFRCLSVRRQLLSGMLAADLVGFQTANYARHFRQTVSRIMSYEALPRGIQLVEGQGESRRSRFVDVGVFPMGIDVQQFQEKRRDPDVAEWVQVLKQRYAGMKIVVGRDKLDEIQGVRHKLLAFQNFLERYPDYQNKVVLIQVALQTTVTDLAGNIADIVTHINSRFSTLTWQPVVFLPTQDLTFSQYLALLTVADAFLVTSLREGMALRTHEFVECQEDRHRPLILSEFTGSYSYSGFRSCIAINPWDTRGTADAINQALTMSDDEALSRWEDLHSHVTTQTGQAFVTSFLARCIRANSEQHLQTQQAAPTLDMSRVLPRYKHSPKRLLLIDFEGTLWTRPKFGTAPEQADPGLEKALELLRRLAADRRNNLWLLSGLSIAGVLTRIAKEVPFIGIVAENGCFIRPKASPPRSASLYGMNGHGGRRSGPDLAPVNIAASLPGGWISMVSTFNLTWKSSCVEILNYFTERTPGSFVEEREASIVWRFWTGETMKDCGDRQWALRQAAEAQNHIFDSLGERYGLRIIPGDNSFLVLPNNISRSTAVGAILHPGGPAATAGQRAGWLSPSHDDDGIMNGDLDLVLAVTGDEKLIRRLNEFETAETVATGGKATDARWKLENCKVVETLGVFASVPAP